MRDLKGSRADMMVFRAPCGALFLDAAARELLGAADSGVLKHVPARSRGRWVQLRSISGV
jgi:hypothetical protein